MDRCTSVTGDTYVSSQEKEKNNWLVHQKQKPRMKERRRPEEKGHKMEEAQFPQKFSGNTSLEQEHAVEEYLSPHNDMDGIERP